MSERSKRQLITRERKENGLTPIVYKSHQGAKKMREEMSKALPGNLNPKRLGSILALYGEQCLLTLRRDNLHIDHFIPSSWGHGGNYEGNLIAVHQSLNVGKTNKNPFEWIQQEWVIDSIGDLTRWVILIKGLAKNN